MPIPLLLIGAGIMAAAGAYKTYHGARQAAKGRDLAANNIRPNYDIQKEYYDNQSLAENMAQSGLSEDALQYYTNNSERGLSAGIDNVLQAGGNVNSISSAVDAYNKSLGQVAATDAEMKNNNIKYLIDQNTALAGQKTMKWSLDKYEPYKDTAATATALQKTGNENVSGGIDQVASAAAAYSSAQTYADAASGGGDEGMAGTWIGGGGTPAQRQKITTVRPSAVVQPVAMGGGGGDGTTFNASPNDLNSVYGTAPSAIDAVMQDYENSPYKDQIRKRLLATYGSIG